MLLSLDKISVEFGGRWLLKEVSFQFVAGERLALIGRNGSGKSTLLKIMMGLLSPSEGKVHKVSGLSMGYFHQDLLSYQTDKSVFELVKESFQPLLDIQAEIETLLAKLEAGKAEAEDLDTLSTKQAEFTTKGGDQMEGRIYQTLSGLGFTPEEFHMPFHTFSGGWRMRALLAKMLLNTPDLLLLDEPTNHLDLPSIQWLENYLKTFQGTCIIVSHDRFFVDRLAEKILEIRHLRLHEFAGNYSFYEKEKELRYDQLKKTYDNQQKHIKEQERFINRFRAKASKARQVQSKIKQLDKIERVEAPEEDHVSFSFRFTLNRASGKEVLTLSDVGKSYDQKHIFSQAEAQVMRGDKIGLIGPNGQGKSTLLNIIAGTTAYEGSVEKGYHVSQTFFAQHQLEALTLTKTIWDEIADNSTDRTEQELRNALGAFLFSGDTVDKKVGVLSGGEKSRVALVKTLLSEANFLLLDEPTNHLDITSIQTMIEALNAYEGSYIIVSHDRYFLRQVTNKVWYIQEKQVKAYPGSYLEYEDWVARTQAAEAEATSAILSPSISSEEKKPVDFKLQKQQKNKLKKLEREIATLEEKIDHLEADKKRSELQMASPEVASDFSKLQAEQENLHKITQQLEELTESWAEKSEEYEALTS
ncbi:MAG: ABC-F family ATP-binding cassette domain-containing protein [Bacteroidota bacterium]